MVPGSSSEIIKQDSTHPPGERMNHHIPDDGREILTEINSSLNHATDSSVEPADINGMINRINRAVIEVSRELGSGFLPEVYENALMIELKKQGLRARNHVSIKVYYKGVPIGEYFTNIMVEDTIIVDLKMVDKLQKMHKTYLLNCLKATGYKVGLLVNFANEQAEIQKFSL